MEKTYIIDSSNVLRSRNSPPRLAVNLAEPNSIGSPIVSIVLTKDNPTTEDQEKYTPGKTIVGVFTVKEADAAPAETSTAS